MRSPDYGIDAPNLIRNRVVAGVVAFLIAEASRVGILPGELVLRPVSQVVVQIPLGMMGLWAGLGFSVTACWMYIGSRFGKVESNGVRSIKSKFCHSASKQGRAEVEIWIL